MDSYYIFVGESMLRGIFKKSGMRPSSWVENNMEPSVIESKLHVSGHITTRSYTGFISVVET